MLESHAGTVGRWLAALLLSLPLGAPLGQGAPWVVKSVHGYRIALVVESVREKVYARMISERKRIAAQFRSEGEGRSAEILGTMEKELRQIRSTAYRRVQEIRGKADAEATRVYGAAYSGDPEFYAFSRTLEAYKEGQNKNSVVILTTDSDYYRYLKQAGGPVSARPAR